MKKTLFMLGNKILPALIALSLLAVVGCGQDANGPAALVSPEVAQVRASFRDIKTNNPKPLKIFSEPLTNLQIPDPRAQFSSYQKILRALAVQDFDYARMEFDAGGLKAAAVRADTEFAEFPLASSSLVVLQNVGLIGLEEKDITSFDSAEKTQILDKLIKNVLIYNVRGLTNRLIEYNKSGLAKDDEYSVKVANNIYTYFYGNESGSPSSGSVAEFARATDQNNAVSAKSYDQISAALGQIRGSTRDNLNSLLTGKNQLEKGLYKMLYLATLENLALADTTKNVTLLNDVEYYYIGIKKPVKVTSRNNNSFLDQMLSFRRLDVIEYNKFEKGLNQGFFERATDELNNAIAKITTDNSSARNSALSAQLLIDIPNSTFTNTKVSHTANEELTSAAVSFKNAIQNKNLDSAKLFRDKLYGIINSSLK